MQPSLANLADATSKLTKEFATSLKATLPCPYGTLAEGTTSSTDELQHRAATSIQTLQQLLDKHQELINKLNQQANDAEELQELRTVVAKREAAFEEALPELDAHIQLLSHTVDSIEGCALRIHNNGYQPPPQQVLEVAARIRYRTHAKLGIVAGEPAPLVNPHMWASALFQLGLDQQRQELRAAAAASAAAAQAAVAAAAGGEAAALEAKEATALPAAMTGPMPASQKPALGLFDDFDDGDGEYNSDDYIDTDESEDEFI